MDCCDEWFDYDGWFDHDQSFIPVVGVDKDMDEDVDEEGKWWA